jgi:CRP-like cAMP-binding protein
MALQIELVKNIPYFAGLTQAELDSVYKMVKEKSYSRGDTVFMDGEPANELYFLASGAIKTFKTSVGGKEQIIRIVRPGESFNDVPVFDSGLTLVSAQTMSAATVYSINREDLEYLMGRYPKISRNVINVLAKRVRNLVLLIEDLSFRTVIGRVAKILLDTATEAKGDGPKLTQQEMAAIAGTAREVVGRSLKSLEDDGIIKLDRHRIIITDKDALKRMVSSSI